MDDSLFILWIVILIINQGMIKDYTHRSSLNALKETTPSI